MTEQETIEQLNVLVNHFRDLANAKEDVIKQYRELLTNVKPSVKEEYRLNKVVQFMDDEKNESHRRIRLLECEVEKLQDKNDSLEKKLAKFEKSAKKEKK